jgi:ABC-type sugar transport system substrate-binding protein
MYMLVRVIVRLGTGLIVGLFITSTALAQAKPKVAFVPQLVGIPYFNAMEDGGKDAAEKFGADFIYTGPADTNPADQLRIVNGLIDQGVNAVSLSVLDASSIDPIINKAKQKGIHIFTSDSDAPKSAREVYVAQALDQDLGFTIIDELAKRIGEQGKVGIVSGEATATNLNTWINFMRQRVKEKYPRINLLAPQFAGGTAQRAFQIATDGESGPERTHCGCVHDLSRSCTSDRIGRQRGTGHWNRVRFAKHGSSISEERGLWIQRVVEPA